MTVSLSSTAEQRTAIKEAARWFARLQASQADEAARAAWSAWMARHPENRNAWSKVQAVQQQFAAVPGHVALPTLQNVDHGRRRLLSWAAAGGALLPLGFWMSDDAHRARWTADFRTAIGEVAPLPLTDGTVAILDTNSAADVDFTADVRRIVLRAGRLYTNTHADNAARSRPFIVQTRHGTVEALGTEFMVRVTDTHSKVWVNEHAVRVSPRGAPDAPMIIRAGHRATFEDRDLEAGPVEKHDALAASNFAPWRNGSLVATNMRLPRFVERFQAYQRGYLFLDDSLANVEVSGVFPLFKPELALAALENSYPVQVRRLTRYLTWIEPRA
ncbi:Iron dicitrate transport regulator FecR [Bordetella tumbae]|uniref:FecR domain-containing protein n=1 Tax=Bordetella tumbae TaxID=1649139 RepID=UPI0039EE26CC